MLKFMTALIVLCSSLFGYASQAEVLADRVHADRVSADRVHADRVRFLFDDREAIQARVDLVQQAESEILVEYFSVWNDEQSVGGIALLVDAAKRGVKVKVILDALSNTVPNSLFAALMAKGVDSRGRQNLEIRVYNPVSLNLFKLTHRTHAKMLILDNKRILTGGRNVGDKYFGLNKKRNYDDLDIITEGKIVNQARDNFFAVWNSNIVKTPEVYEYSEKNLEIDSCASKENFDQCENARQTALKTMNDEIERIRFHLTEIIKEQPDDIVQSQTGRDWLKNGIRVKDIKFMSHQPDKLVTEETATMTHELLELIKKTEKEIVIVSPYLIPTPNLRDAFAELISRGVKVKIITNSLQSTDNVFAQAGYRKYKRKLIKMGIEIHEYKGPNTVHAKTAVIDGKISLVGTYNVDPRSAFINREIGVVIFEDGPAPVATKLLGLIHKYQASSFLVAKDGIEFNTEKEFEGVSKKKKLSLRIVNFILPLIERQL